MQSLFRRLQHTRHYSMSGRGAYFKAKYGGGGRGGRGSGRGDGGGRHSSDREGRGEKRPHSAHTLEDDRQARPATANVVRGSADDLHALLTRGIDGRQYPAYKDITGSWDFDGSFILHIHHVQSDAYASPSQCRVLIPHRSSSLPSEVWRRSKVSRIASCDFLARCFAS